MDPKTIELYCKYIIRPLEKQKNKLEREILKTKLMRRFIKKRELFFVKKMLDEKLKYLSELIYGKEEGI